LSTIFCPVVYYADDTLLLLRAEEGQVRRLKRLLDSFAATTGLHIKFHKSTFIPIGVDADRAGELAMILECPISAFPQTYLGLPLSTSKITIAMLDAIAIKAERAVPGWRTSLLSKARCLTLVESVLTAQAVYTMFVLSFPLTVLAKLDRPCEGLFWAGTAKCSGGACQVAWELACHSKEDG
jgi:hypothetical protein